LDKTERRDRGLDAIARDNPADSLMHRGQMVFAVPSLHWARVHWKGKPDPHGPDAGQWLRWLNHVGQPVARRDAPHPRGTTLERLSGWIRTTGGQPVTQGPRQPLPEYFEPGGRRLGWEPLGRGTSWHGHFRGLQAVPVDLPAGRPPATPGTAAPPPSSGCPTTPWDPGNMHAALGMASSSSLPIGSYDSH